MEHPLIPSLPNMLRRAAALAPLVLVACGGEMIGEPLGQEGAHEHGVAAVGIVVDGHAATVGFRAPAGDLWGFERPPASQDEIDARATALAALEAGIVTALGFDTRLGCGLTSTRWDGAAAQAPKAEEPHDGAHSREGGHDHGHHAQYEADDHHDEDEHHDHESSDVIAEFDILCAEALAGSRLTLAIADLFEAIEKVDLQTVSEARQFGRRVPARGSSIEL